MHTASAIDGPWHNHLNSRPAVARRHRVLRRAASAVVGAATACAAMVAVVPATAHADALDFRGFGLGGSAFGASGSVTLSNPMAMVNIPKVAEESLSTCALPHDGQTSEVALTDVMYKTPSPIRIGLEEQTSDDKGVEQLTPDVAGVTEESRIQGLNLLVGSVTADVIDVTAHTTVVQGGAGGGFILSNHTAPNDPAPTGMIVDNLKVFGTTINGTVAPNTTIYLTSDHKNYVALNQQTPRKDGINIKGIHVHLAAFDGFTGDVTIASANTTIHSGFSRVNGDAYATSLKVKVGPVSINTGALGRAAIGCFGGHSKRVIASVTRNLPDGSTLLNTGEGTAVADGTDGTAPNVTSSEDIANVNLLNTLITADALHVNTQTSTVGTVVTSTGGTQFVNLVVNGQPIDASPAPNTKITLPGLGYVVLNEHRCAHPIQGGCVNSNNESIQVNAIHVFITIANNTLNLKTGATLVVSHASSGAHLPA
jgi:hypothetical protein